MQNNEQVIKEWEELGKKWLNDEFEFDGIGDIKFNEKQKLFVNSKTRFSLVSGGFASGKTTGFIAKLYLLAMMFPNNRILLGRKTRADVEKATLPDIIDIFPVGTYTHKIGPGEIHFANGSRILFYGLDAMQAGAGQDIKKAEQKIKSLNLGAVFIDQLEEVEERVVMALDGRLRRNLPFRQMNFTTNPANFWAYDYFKANPRPNTLLIETSMFDNKENLPQDYIDSQLSQPEIYVRRYVYGEWSPDSLVEGGVFAKEYIQRQEGHTKKPIREVDGVLIYHEPKMSTYQIGVDPSTGTVDPCSICVVDKESGEQVATYSGFVPTNVIVEKTVQLAMMYSLKEKPLVIPESTGIGQAFIEELKRVYSRIYEREVFNQREKIRTKKLGFSTNFATKTQMIEHMKGLLQKQFPKFRERALVEELKTFIYTDEARFKGAGAQNNYHDDRIMSAMLAYWNIEAKTLREKSILDREEKNKGNNRVVQYVYE